MNRTGEMNNRSRASLPFGRSGRRSLSCSYFRVLGYPRSGWMFFAFFVSSWLILIPVALRAQTSYPMLTHVYPAGVQRGTTTEVTVHGRQDFAGVYKVLLEGEGLSAEVVPPKPKLEEKKPPESKKGKGKPSVDSVTLKVTAAP